MRRPAIFFLMLFAMLWQSMVLAGVSSTVNLMADLEHASLHWQEEGHHHHDDGSYHLDDSQESVQHRLSDHLGASAALLSFSSHDFPPLGSSTPRCMQGASMPNPF